MTELKPCPFCGEESDIYLGDSTDGYIRGTQYIEAYCNRCGARIKGHLVSETIEAWNTRANPWHTGTPTEEGWYLVAIRFGGRIEYESRKCIRTIDNNGNGCMRFDGCNPVLAWQKIESFKEENNG